MYPFLERGVAAARERQPNVPLGIDEANVMNGWPEGTIGHFGEKDLARQLLALGQKYGALRVAQISAGIAEMYSHPEKTAELAQQTHDQIETIVRLRQEMQESLTLGSQGT
jgi:hypothetical protein